MNNVLLNLNSALKQKTPFVFYRKPFDNKVHQIIQNNNNVYYLENYNQKGFVFAPFDNDNNTIIFPLEKSTNSKNIFNVEEINNEIPNLNIDNPYKKKHIKLVEKGIQFINTNNTPKIVLSRKEEVHLTNISLIDTYKNLLNSYNTAFVYLWHHPEIGTWLGATPETLLQTKNNNFKTMALAGTQGYNNDINVSWDKKEIQEHKFVSDFIIEELSKMNIKCNISDVTTVKAGNLLHLHAIISGRLTSLSQIKELIKALHPTPAVCGLPKEKAKKFILKNENYNREFYTGFLGELNFEKDNRQQKTNRRNIENHAYQYKETHTSLFVNLRCMQVNNNSIYIYVGGGITKDSNPEKEYLETVAKAQVMKSALK